ncbi:MAG: glycosyltransferase family 1 protein [Deltaproteobacteria bacterium]|nr:MAG: glycosyltransferase family 1 protein [Deltaproteobacteria bacterium]
MHQRLLWTREYDELFSGRLLAEIESVAPDLLWIDVINTLVAMAAASRAIRCLHYTTSLSQRIGATPPITTALGHDSPPVQAEAAAWARACLPVWGSWHFYEHALVRFEYPADRVSFATCFTPELADVPDHVLPPAALDLPAPAPAARLHASVPVDLDRPEHVAPELERFVDGRPLVYVSLGSRAHRFADAPTIFRAVLSALRAHPEWQAVVAAGSRVDALEAERPDNVVILGRAPQIWVLRRACVFVTHGGMGALREAIGLGVPMIVVPLVNDGFGNAARIEHHGIGIELPLDAVDGARLAAAVARVMRERAVFCARVRQLEAACAREIAEERAPAIVERALSSPRGTPREPGLRQRDAASVDPECGWWFASSIEALGPREQHAAVGAPGLGRAGFTICRELGPALARAEGSVLARVELRGEREHAEPYVTGRTLVRLWQLDVRDLLEAFALRCVSDALDDERATHPEVVDAFVALFARHRAGQDCRAPLERLGAPRAHRGYVVGLEALDGHSHQAARFARDTLILVRCRQRAATAADYLEVRPAVIQEVDRSLVRAVADAAARGGLSS